MATRLSASIAAASIIAKVERDAMISAWDPVFPEYGLASNKGYSTPKHLKMLREKGPTPLHRLSFAPVWTSTAPQEVLEFMLEEQATAETSPEVPEGLADASESSAALVLERTDQER